MCLSQINYIKSGNDASLFFKSTLIDIFQKPAPELDKKVRGNFCPWFARKWNVMKQIFVLEKPNRNTIKIYWMKIFDYRTNSAKWLRASIWQKSNNHYRLNLSKLTQSLLQIQRSLQMALLTSVLRLFQSWWNFYYL